METHYREILTSDLCVVIPPENIFEVANHNPWTGLNMGDVVVINRWGIHFLSNDNCGFSYKKVKVYTKKYRTKLELRYA